jgi:outer membrane protein assembly factor BamE
LKVSLVALWKSAYRGVWQEGMMRAYYDADGCAALQARLPANPTLGIRFGPMHVSFRNSIALALAVGMLLISSGCVYRANISQGNIVEEEDLDQVEAGMTRNQVRFLLGTPMIDDSFHRNRWDYVYYVKIGRNDATAKRWVTILFEADTVSEIQRNRELSEDL